MRCEAVAVVWCAVICLILAATPSLGQEEDEDWENQLFVIRMHKYVHLHERDAVQNQVTEFLDLRNRLKGTVELQHLPDEHGASFPTFIAPVHLDDIGYLAAMEGVKEVIPQFDLHTGPM
eukprot:TRINITY_DN52578_c0_g1_i1.p2 TRINITY_DN52578_c0_g1~~TRINITY_DN52578_c0_g1_i1.p2  ORF type:complete len:138 (+),score=37.59 TRINITY_DN52578_c0_g1_i1:55-414(+)